MSKKQLYNVSEVIDALEKSYKNIYRKKKPVYGYKGPLLTTSKILACSPNIDEQFTEEGIEYHTERSRSLLHVALLSAFQLGIEQGLNMVAEDFWGSLSAEDWDEEDWVSFEVRMKAFLYAYNPKYQQNMTDTLRLFKIKNNENE